MLSYSSTIEGVIAEYLLCCQTEGKSMRTVEWYRQKLGYFAQFLQGNSLATEVEGIGAAEIRRFIHHLQTGVQAGANNPHRPTEDKPLSPQTVAGYVRTLRAFFSWAEREGLVDEHPMKHVKTPKVPQRDMPFFSDAEIARLLAALRQPTAVGQRNYALAVLLLDTGMRVSELIHMEMQDLHLSQGYFSVIGQGDKQRAIPLGRSSCKVLLDYLRKHRPEPSLPQCDNVFLTRTGGPLRPDYVYQIISHACRQVGITGKRLGPHTCRHTFARSFLLNGGDLITLQRILGHTSLEVVKIYVNLQTEDLLAQQWKYSPMDTLKAKSSGAHALVAAES